MHYVQAEQSSNREVIKLVKYSDKEFAVVSCHSRFNVRGTLKTAMQALRGLGVSFPAIEEAYLDMNLKDNNVAEFGIWKKTFLYSTRVELKTHTSGVA